MWNKNFRSQKTTNFLRAEVRKFFPKFVRKKVPVRLTRTPSSTLRKSRKTSIFPRLHRENPFDMGENFLSSTSFSRLRNKYGIYFFNGFSFLDYVHDNACLAMAKMSSLCSFYTYLSQFIEPRRNESPIAALDEAEKSVTTSNANMSFDTFPPHFSSSIFTLAHASVGFSASSVHEMEKSVSVRK